MAVSYVGATSGTSGTTASTFATSFPSGWAAGDVAVLVGHVSAASLTMSVPAGWNPITGVTNPTSEGANSRVYAWVRVLQTGDTAPTITNSGAVTGGWEMGVFRDADQATPTGQASTTTAAAATSVALPSLASLPAGSALWASVHARVASGTIPNGITFNAAYTEVADVATSRATSQANLRNAGAYRLIASAGTYGGESTSVANSISSSLIAVLVEVQQASAATVTADATLAVTATTTAGAVTTGLAQAGLAATATLAAGAVAALTGQATLAATATLSAAAVTVTPVTLRQSFDGGTGAASGATLSSANTNGAGNTALNQVSVGSGATAVFDSAIVNDGTLSALFTTGGTATTSYASWTTAWGTQNTSFMWSDIYLPAAPAANLRIFGALVDAATLGAIVVINASRQILIANSAGATVYTSATNAVPVGAWFRLEFAVTHDGSAGTAQLKLYNSTSSTTADVDSGLLTGLNTGAQSTILRYGIGQSGANLSVRLDRTGGANVIAWGQGGTAAVSATASLAATATLTAGGTLTAAAVAALAATATLTAAATRTMTSAATLAATATLTAAALVTRPAAATLAVTGTLTAGLTKTTPGSASLPVTATLTADAAVGTPPVLAAAALAVTATLTAAGQRTAPGGASLAATATLTAATVVLRPGAASLAVTVTLTAGAFRLTQAGAALAVVAALVAEAVAQGSFIQRPDAGVTARPTTGASTRPDLGVTARTVGVTVRPFTTTTARP